MANKIRQKIVKDQDRDSLNDSKAVLLSVVPWDGLRFKNTVDMKLLIFE